MKSRFTMPGLNYMAYLLSYEAYLLTSESDLIIDEFMDRLYLNMKYHKINKGLY